MEGGSCQLPNALTAFVPVGYRLDWTVSLIGRKNGVNLALMGWLSRTMKPDSGLPHRWNWAGESNAPVAGTVVVATELAVET